MSICPRCRRQYPSTERFCPLDSTVLVEDIDIARIGTTVGNYHLIEILGRGGFAVEARPTSAPGDATRLARVAVDENADVVFSLGGDGTLREVAAGAFFLLAVLGALLC